MESKSTLYGEVVVDMTDLPKETRAIFEYLGAYFVDTYYNRLMATAKEYLAKGSRTTLTECYRLAITNFLVAFRDFQNAYKILNDYYEYYTKYTTLQITYEECVFLIVKECIPDEFFKRMSRQQKTTFLMRIWTAAIQTITDLIYKRYMSMILDDRSEDMKTFCVKQLQDEMINILATIREGLYGEFFQNTHQSADASRISHSAAGRMKDTVQKLSKEKISLQSKITKMEEIIYKQHKQLKKIGGAYSALVTQAKTMQVTLRNYEKAMGVKPQPVYITQEEIPTHPKKKSKERKRESKKKHPDVVQRDYFSVKDFNKDLERIDAPKSKSDESENSESEKEESDEEESNDEESDEDTTVIKQKQEAQVDRSLLSDIQEMNAVRKTQAPLTTRQVTPSPFVMKKVDTNDDVPALDMY